MHAGTCDLWHSATPGATVIIVRQSGDTLEYLVLCDSVLVLQPRAGEPRAITDTQLDETMARHRRLLADPGLSSAPGARLPWGVVWQINRACAGGGLPGFEEYVAAVRELQQDQPAVVDPAIARPAVGGPALRIRKRVEGSAAKDR
jgi:hypothetical protein